MNIAIDVRPLLDSNLTGVGEYTYNIVKNLLIKDKNNKYFLFYNQRQKPKFLPSFKGNYQYCPFNYPNKIFNTLVLGRFVQIDKLINKKFNTEIDIFLFPNISFINTSKNCKKIIVVHDLSFEINPKFFSAKRQLWHKIINPKKLLKTSDQIISVSNNTKYDIENLYNINKEKISTIYPGLDKSYDPVNDPGSKLNEIKNKYKLPDNFILFLSTLEPRKNIIGLIEAFNNTKTDIDLVIAGGKGWNYKKIYSAYNNSPKKNKIHFLGYIEQKDKNYIYNLAKIFVYPSFYEGFGFPPMEAAKSGSMVLTSNVSSINEINKNSVLYTTPYNTKISSKIIDAISSDNDLQKHFIKKSLQQSKQYTWEKSAENLYDVILQLKKI